MYVGVCVCVCARARARVCMHKVALKYPERGWIFFFEKKGTCDEQTMVEARARREE